MTVSERFVLGQEETMNHRHIGRLVDIDLLQQQGKLGGGKSVWRSLVCIGRIAGVTEDRGVVTISPGENPGDYTFEGEYNVTILFEDGTRVDIRDRDIATITVIGEGE